MFHHFVTFVNCQQLILWWPWHLCTFWYFSVSYEIMKLLSYMLRPPDFSTNPRWFTSIPDHLTSLTSKGSDNGKLAHLVKVNFSVVYMCVCVWPRVRGVSLYRAQPPSVGVPITPVVPHPHQCSNLFTMHVILSVSGQLTLNRNAFLSYISFGMKKGRSDMSLLTFLSVLVE